MPPGQAASMPPKQAAFQVDGVNETSYKKHQHTPLPVCIYIGGEMHAGRNKDTFGATYSKGCRMSRMHWQICGEASRVPTNDTMSEATLKNSTAEATCAMKGHGMSTIVQVFSVCFALL